MLLKTVSIPPDILLDGYGDGLERIRCNRMHQVKGSEAQGFSICHSLWKANRTHPNLNDTARRIVRTAA